jgi:hypothetical protein
MEVTPPDSLIKYESPVFVGGSYGDIFSPLTFSRALLVYRTCLSSSVQSQLSPIFLFALSRALSSLSLCLSHPSSPPFLWRIEGSSADMGNSTGANAQSANKGNSFIYKSISPHRNSRIEPTNHTTHSLGCFLFLLLLLPRPISTRRNFELYPTSTRMGRV